MIRAKAAAKAAASVALVAMVGVGAFVAARDEPRAAPPPTTTTTTTTAPTTTDDLALAIAASLSTGLDVPLTVPEARCVADGLVTALGPARLEALAAGGTGVDAAEQTQLVRAVVVCVPPEKAASLLGSNPSTTVVVELPGEVTEP
ncbi:MAG: hypothetical protein ABIX10_00805 [Acidimicrobiales bacterium]